MIFLAYWRQLLAAAVALVALVAAYHAGTRSGAVKLAQAQQEWAEAQVAAAQAVRATEAAWRQELQIAQEGYANEIEALRRKRNSGTGAAVRVCLPAAGTDPTGSGAAAAAGAGQAAPAAGMVSEPVPQGTDLGPMLRIVIERADELSAQVRALQAAWPK